MTLHSFLFIQNPHTPYFSVLQCFASRGYSLLQSSRLQCFASRSYSLLQSWQMSPQTCFFPDSKTKSIPPLQVFLHDTYSPPVSTRSVDSIFPYAFIFLPATSSPMLIAKPMFHPGATHCWLDDSLWNFHTSIRPYSSPYEDHHQGVRHRKRCYPFQTLHSGDTLHRSLPVCIIIFNLS